MRNNDEGASLGGNKRQGDKSAEMNAEKIQQRAVALSGPWANPNSTWGAPVGAFMHSSRVARGPFTSNLQKFKLISGELTGNLSSVHDRVYAPNDLHRPARSWHNYCKNVFIEYILNAPRKASVFLTNRLLHSFEWLRQVIQNVWKPQSYNGLFRNKIGLH